MSPIDQLLTVQEHDIRIRDIEKELHDIPLRKKRELTRLDEHSKALAAAETALKAKQAEIKTLEGETQSLNEKINKFRQQQMDLKTNKEFKAMEDEIKAVQQMIAEVEDRELVLMEELEAAKNDVQEKKAALTDENSAISADVKLLDQRSSEIEADRARERLSRSESAKGLASDWLKTYDRIFSRKDRAIVMLEDGICGGCHMRLPPAMYHDTRRNEAMVLCNYCGRMLYWKQR